MTNMKRCHSDDSDSDDFYDDNIGSPTQSGNMSERKKRRGIIEKRRRDRINNSLIELRRLVPAAFEKQGSAKLEKAEILQMTVDHLKMLHAKGLNGYGMDTAALAMDYRTMGFRECAAEVARYTVTMEGMDLHDPLRLRLLGHLQCYCSQRESAAKAASLHSHHAASSTPASAPWSGMQAPPQYPPVIGADQCLGLGSSQHSTAAPTYTDLGRMTTQHATEGLGSTAASAAAGCSVASRTPATHPSYVTSSGGGMGPGSGSSHFMLQGLPQMYNHHQFPMPLSAMNSVLSTPSGVQPGSFAAQHALGKPYRPWGLELAY